MSPQDPGGGRHALNNVLCKIIGSAELALDRVRDDEARSELDAIIQLAEAGALIVKALEPQPAQAG